ncbi:dihydrofolate reductase family protein [Sporomusa sp.]|uniref:dihydrofolate reductase family protein n=1 Tax=Sporomusa sp. TaxID=2078658 RepID=UPI002D1C539C|nr:dihydrofolate reductase family protein [Sporomusa sp.]HWR44972.1 dihydrofolate reductase family protein [Sporomusa sp.]
MERKVILYIAMSVDGYIARLNGDIDWLSIVDKPPEDYGYAKFIETVDTVIMGRKTYDKVLSFNIDFPHNGRKCYVISKTRTGVDQNIEYYSDDLEALITGLKKKEGKNIFVDGGAEIVNELFKSKMIDELIISIIPTVLGNGIRLFQDGRPEQKLRLKSTLYFETGLVQLCYCCEKQ